MNVTGWMEHLCEPPLRETTLVQGEDVITVRGGNEFVVARVRMARLLRESLAFLLLETRREERLHCSHELEELGYEGAARAVRDRWAERLYP